MSKVDVGPSVVSALKEILPTAIPGLDPWRRPLEKDEGAVSCKGGPDLGFYHQDRDGIVLVQVESPFIRNTRDLDSSMSGFISSAIKMHETSTHEWYGPILDAYLIVGRENTKVDVEGLWDKHLGITFHCLSWDDVAKRIIDQTAAQGESDYTIILKNIVELSRRLLSLIARHPHLLNGINDRQFEEIMATLLLDVGFSNVELTPPRQDGGKDIIAVYPNPETRCEEVYLFECKHWVSGRRVTARWAVSLLDVVQKADATAGVLLSTSGFGRRLLDHEMTFRSRGVILKDQKDLYQWLQLWERLYGEVLIRPLDPREVVGLLI
jgi:hypothetical protein